MKPLDALVRELEALPQRQLEGAFPFVVIMIARVLGEVPPSLAPALAALPVELGWSSLDTNEAKDDAANAWLTAHGVDAELWERLVAALEDDPASLRDAARRINAQVPLAGALERRAPPPPGSVAAGPFARHQISTLKR